MDRFEIQRKIFRIVAILLLVSVLALIAVIPRLIKGISTDGLPNAAAIATSVAAGVRLLILLGILYGIRLTKRKRRFNKEINIAVAVVIFLLGFVLLDGAVAYIGSQNYVSAGMFVSVFCDLAATVVLIVAVFLLRTKKQKQAAGK
jgi:hypothetical protein